ncbi:uncharacterized protein N7500_008992 [Penicillium coprophilum]|uniref:uncharacterized protein n=1 Tax=Penicillium coprophilum TaxID=36646 RepID=UPI002381D7CB|nr:uncharacterized protein N7500_008992 [Penicillium coprophilum]KAJ5159341.1 hypothetical protein N7500_008992 [Penicillium coprophilum]
MPDQVRRRQWREESRKRRGNLHIPECLTWGAFNLDFPTLDNPGVVELQIFMRELDGEAQWAKSREEIIAEFMRKLLPLKSPLNIIASIPSAFPGSSGDMILLKDSRALDDCLREKFDKPLLYRGSVSGNSLSGRQLSLDAFWMHLREQINNTIDVYDYTVADPAGRTRRMAVQEVLSHWEIPQPKRHAINLLDIENRIGDFCPTEIIRHDLSNKLSCGIPENLGKTESQWRNERREFFLLSGANAISSIHVDNGAQLTWIMILEGRKIWYFPRKVTDDAVRLLALAGSQWSHGYEEGWVRVELCAGDLLVMPPSFPHAVFTPDDCLAVGGHFYTAPHLSSTLRGLRLQEDYPDICNEDLQADFYNLLTSLLHNGSQVWTATQRVDILTSSSLFLDNLDTASLAIRYKANGRASRSRGASDRQSRVIERLNSRSTSRNYLGQSRTLFMNALEVFRKQLLETWDIHS